MSSTFYAGLSRFESEIVTRLKTVNGERLHAAKIFAKIIEAVNHDIARNEISRNLAFNVRLAIKLNPYSTDAPKLMSLHHQVLRQVMQRTMPKLFDPIAACRARQLPVPVILSCDKYLPKARALQSLFQERYFGIAPLIVRGDPAAAEEHYEAPVLTLPVADSYEALPVKVFETATFLRAMDDAAGFLKIDDDLTLTPLAPLNAEHVSAVFAAADYMGIPLRAAFQDRTWHVGKCQTPVPPIYGKPFKAMWGRGALYALTARALDALTASYMRFPGYLEGELFEDKAVGDVLYDNGIILTGYVFEHLLGIDSTSLERPIEE